MKFLNLIPMVICGLSFAAGNAAGASPSNVVVIRFAVPSQTFADPKSLSVQACPGVTSEAQPATAPLRVDPKVLDAITEELQKKLSEKKMSVMLLRDPNTIPAGSLVIIGCVTRAVAGNAAERLVGMNLGTSYLGAHVRLLSETRAGLVPLDEFDVQTKGGKVLPPIGLVGLAAHAASEPRETLSADAKKLAAQIVKRVANTMKAQTNAMAATNGGGWSGYCRYIQDRTGTRVYEQSLKVPSSPNAEIHD